MPNFGEGVPNRGTSEQQLDAWNRQMRASPVYQQFMQQRGLPTDGRVRLSREQQSALEAVLRASGMQIPSGMHIDQGGNLNQKNRLVRNAAIGAGIGAGALATAGAMGAGPLASMFGGGGAAGSAGAAGGSLAPIAGGAPWAVTPYAGTAASAGTGLGAAAGGAAGAAGAAGGAARGAGNILSGLSASDIAALGLTTAGTIGGALADKPNYNPNTQTTDPALQELLAIMSGRIRKSEPLYDSILSMANGLLPTQYQRGGGGVG